MLSKSLLYYYHHYCYRCYLLGAPSTGSRTLDHHPRLQGQDSNRAWTLSLNVPFTTQLQLINSFIPCAAHFLGKLRHREVVELVHVWRK